MDQRTKMDLMFKVVDCLVEKFSPDELDTIRWNFDGGDWFNICGEAINEIKDKDMLVKLRDRMAGLRGEKK